MTLKPMGKLYSKKSSWREQLPFDREKAGVLAEKSKKLN